MSAVFFAGNTKIVRWERALLNRGVRKRLITYDDKEHAEKVYIPTQRQFAEEEAAIKKQAR